MYIVNAQINCTRSGRPGVWTVDLFHLGNGLVFSESCFSYENSRINLTRLSHISWTRGPTKQTKILVRINDIFVKTEIIRMYEIARIKG